MNIYKILSSKERQKILEDILYKEGEISVSKVSSRLNLSKGLVSDYFKILVNEYILKRNGGKYVVQDNLNVKALKILLNLNRFNWKFFEEFDFVRGAGLYGSFVKGGNTEDSDIDLYVLVEESEEENLAELTGKLNELDERINPLYLTEDKIKHLKNEDAVFYHSLVFGSINIYGVGIEEI